ncbi:MAG: T9SS type A sorting domain-containing protein [Candidatus Latescibacterota bacterium]
MKFIPKPFVWFFAICLSVTTVGAETNGLSAIFSSPSAGLGANDLGDMAWDGRSLWVSGSGTLNNRIGEGSGLYDWITFKQLDGFGQGSNSALVAYGDTLITAWGYSDEYLGELVPYGDGISLSLNRGTTWKHITVKDLFPDRAALQNPGRYTTTYDIVLSRGIIWCSTTSGFLLKSTDIGKSWTNILPNNETLDLTNPNHHAQCLDAYSDTLWVGTFQGINASFDRGKTWTNHSWTAANSGSLTDQKPGNWVYAIEHKVVGGKTHLWAGCDSYIYTNLGQYGICHTDDNGKTWQYKTTKFNAWNFAFGHKGASDPAVSDSTVFAASDSGLVFSNDLGGHWEVMDIRESDQRYWKSGEMVSAVTVVNDTLWAASVNGLARTTDWGKTWKIFKGITRVKTLDTGEKDVGISTVFENVKTYAFPNPFSPSRSDADYSKTRINYALKKDARISISIYDYQGRLLRDLVSDVLRTGGSEYQEIWDGRDKDNSLVPNGVYFYRIKTQQGDSARGKIMVLD